MKKVLVLFSVVMVLTLTGCFSSSTIKTPTVSSTAGTTTKQTTKTTTATTKQTTTETTTEQTTTSDIGSRKNPFKYQETALLFQKGDSIDAEFTLTITNVIRGKEAAKIVMDENQFNEIPNGKEVVLVWIEFKLNKYIVPDENEEFRISDWDFEFFDSKYTEINSESVVVPDKLAGEMFEGGETAGYIYTMVDPGEVVTVRFGETMWFLTE